MPPSLNDTARFWMAVANCPDLVDDPQGFCHPLADRAAALGVSLGELHDGCRAIQKRRAEHLGESAEQG